MFTGRRTPYLIMAHPSMRLASQIRPRRPLDSGRALLLSRGKSSPNVGEIGIWSVDVRGRSDAGSETGPESGSGSGPSRTIERACKVWSEWDAKRSVLFTPGNGMAALAAVQHEFPLLMLGLSGEHVQLLEYFVDCGVAMAMQASGNRLYDRHMMAKVDRALEGNIDSEDETTPPEEEEDRRQEGEQ